MTVPDTSSMSFNELLEYMSSYTVPDPETGVPTLKDPTVPIPTPTPAPTPEPKPTETPPDTSSMSFDELLQYMSQYLTVDPETGTSIIDPNLPLDDTLAFWSNFVTVDPETGKAVLKEGFTIDPETNQPVSIPTTPEPIDPVDESELPGEGAPFDPVDEDDDSLTDPNDALIDDEDTETTMAAAPALTISQMEDLIARLTDAGAVVAPDGSQETAQQAIAKGPEYYKTWQAGQQPTYDLTKALASGITAKDLQQLFSKESVDAASSVYAQIEAQRAIERAGGIEKAIESGMPMWILEGAGYDKKDIEEYKEYLEEAESAKKKLEFARNIIEDAGGIVEAIRKGFDLETLASAGYDLKQLQDVKVQLARVDLADKLVGTTLSSQDRAEIERGTSEYRRNVEQAISSYTDKDGNVDIIRLAEDRLKSGASVSQIKESLERYGFDPETLNEAVSSIPISDSLYNDFMKSAEGGNHVRIIQKAIGPGGFAFDNPKNDVQREINKWYQDNRGKVTPENFTQLSKSAQDTILESTLTLRQSDQANPLQYFLPVWGSVKSAQENGLTSGWTILSIVGDVALVAPIVKVGTGAIKGAVGIVEVPLKEGNVARVWKGVKIGDKPIVGKSEGKLVFGEGGLTYPKAGEIASGFEPVTKIETRLLTSKKAFTDIGMDPGEIKKIQKTLSGRMEFAGQPSPYLNNDIVATKTLSQDGVETVLKQVNEYGGKKIDTVYGSSTIRAQLSPEDVSWRKLGDIDIQTKMNVADTEKFANEIAEKLKVTEGADNVRIAPDNAHLVEVKGTDGKWHHAVDIHSREVTSGSEISAEGAYGMIHHEPAVKIKYPEIGEVEIMSLSESGKRKAASILEWRDGKVSPPAHRTKDIVDYYTILKTYKGAKYADDWARTFGYEPSDLMKLAKESAPTLEWKFKPVSKTGRSFKAVSGISPTVSIISPVIKSAALVTPSVGATTLASIGLPNEYKGIISPSTKLLTDYQIAALPKQPGLITEVIEPSPPSDGVAISGVTVPLVESPIKTTDEDVSSVSLPKVDTETPSLVTVAPDGTSKESIYIETVPTSPTPTSQDTSPVIDEIVSPYAPSPPSGKVKPRPIADIVPPLPEVISPVTPSPSDQSPGPISPIPPSPSDVSPGTESPSAVSPSPESPSLSSGSPSPSVPSEVGKGRKILLPPLSPAAKKKLGIDDRGTIAWYQGRFGANEIWYVVKYPYKSKADVTRYIGVTPPGISAVQYGDDAAYRSIQLITGKPPKKLSIDLGIQDIMIESPGAMGKTGTIRYRSDAKQKTKSNISVKGAKTLRTVRKTSPSLKGVR